ncbi:MAG: hypothetical protein ACREQ7_25285 [Candidatus Binatia bacterium]
MTEQEIIESIDEVFQVCARLDRKALWNAVVPTDAKLEHELPPNHKHVTYIPSFEFFELEQFIALVNSLVSSSSISEKDKVRLMLTGYCRIMESDLPVAILWNLLRAASGAPESWTFTRISKEGDTLTCEYPREKIDEICRLSSKLSMKIGGVLDELWDPYLRNAVSHSQYFLSGDRFLPSGGLSPISRKQGKDLGTKGRSMTFDEVRVLFELARTFVVSVADRWRRVCDSLNG